MRGWFRTQALVGARGVLLLLACTSREGPVGNSTDAGAAALLSEAEWLAQTAPREGTHEVWSEACNGTRIDQAYRVLPTVICPPRRAADGRFTETRDCRLGDYCQSAADCTARPGGVCRGVASSECVYAELEQASCDQDADCDQLPAGRCMPRIEGGYTNCYPTGECVRTPLRSCSYPSLSGSCQSDAECTAAPGGRCQLLIGPTECRYNQCDGNASCGEGARCECEYQNRCIPADCFSDADCGSGLRCEASLAVKCGNINLSAGYYCRTAEDECQGDADCAGQSCVFDPELDFWACRNTSTCLTR